MSEEKPTAFTYAPHEEFPAWCISAACHLIDTGRIARGITGHEVARVIADHHKLTMPINDVDLATAWTVAKSNPTLQAIGRNVFMRAFPLCVVAVCNDMKFEHLSKDMKLDMSQQQIEMLQSLATDFCKINVQINY